jgi:DNA mismatch endonuclease (patch repair protein)
MLDQMEQASVGGGRSSSWASSTAIRKTMLACRNRDTRAELVLRSMVHASGLRYRVARPPVTGIRRTADMVFSRARIAVFVDGCFWHGCPEHFVPPKTNASYWRTKIELNRERDANTDVRLRAAGWAVIRVWEHEDCSQAASNVIASVREAAESAPSAAAGQPTGSIRDLARSIRGPHTQSRPVKGSAPSGSRGSRAAAARDSVRR